MKRTLATIPCLVCLGTAMSIAIAWGCAAWSELDMVEPRLLTDHERETLAELGWRTTGAFPREGVGTRWEWIPGSEPPRRWPDGSVSVPGGIMPSAACRIEAGFPLRCILAERVDSSPTDGEDEIPDTREWVRSIPTVLSVEWRSIQPLWLGLAVNTVLFSALLCLPFAPRAIRRVLRARRGLCRGCGYPIGSSPACTECGAKLTSTE